MAEERTVLRKVRVGTVVSDRNDKTIVVSVERAARHPIYHKVIRRTKKYHAHDERNEATRGDIVRIEEAAPASRLKRWRLVEILTEREVAQVAPEAIDQSLVEEVQRSPSRTEEDEASETPAAESTDAAGESAEGASDESADAGEEQ